jgi:DNA-directed RNA polymerase subunit RPC12/RpoP
MWECMECSEENDLDPDAEEGQIIECIECGSEFEILKAEPLSLARLSISGDDDGDPDWED